MITGYVYKMIDPIDGKVRYVGQTEDPQKRLRHHWRDRTQPKNLRNHKAHWIAKLWREHKAKPLMEILETIVAECVEDLETKLNDRELFWINYYLESGHDLTNTSHKFFNRVVNHHKITSGEINFKQLFVYDRNGVEQMFISHKEACEKLGFQKKSISTNIKRRSLLNGYVLSHGRLSPEEVQKILMKSAHIGPMMVLDMNTDKIEHYATQQDAAGAFGVSFKIISYIIKATMKRQNVGRCNTTYSHLRMFYGSNEETVILWKNPQNSASTSLL